MPELPEVETITRQIRPGLVGRSVLHVELRLPRLLLGMKPAGFCAAIEGQRVSAILRRGKYIILELEQDALIIHLGMTGQLTHSPPEFREDKRFARTPTGLQRPLGVHPIDSHTHFLVHLDTGERLLFRDPRTFGRLIWVPERQWRSHPRISKLGYEPLELRTRAFLDAYPGSSSRPIKSLLLDQGFVAGVGNIYADEALFHCGLSPMQPVSSLPTDIRRELLKSIKHVLRKGIRNFGTSFSDYRQADGSPGKNYERLMVYGQAGKPCRRCRTVLKKTLVAQRGTVYCPACQVLIEPTRDARIPMPATRAVLPTKQ